MDEHKIIQDYIDEYHAGKISEEDFQNRLASDPTLHVAFAQYQQELTIIRAGAKEQLKKKATLALNKLEQKKRSIFSIKRILPLAASLAFLIAAVFLLKNSNQNLSPADLFDTHFTLPNPAGERNVNTQSFAWNDAMIAYTNQDFEQTIDLLSPLVNQKDFPFVDRGHLYLGLSLLMQDKYQDAIHHFDAINPESSFVPDAQWFRALTYLKMGKLEQTKNALQIIVNQARHYKHKEAIEILNNINN